MATRPAIPAGPRDITVDWLRQALAQAGGSDPLELQAVQIEPVGSGRGLLSEVIRCHLLWPLDAQPAPSSVIIKLHSPNHKTSRFARILQLYLREYDFYRRIGPAAAIRSPAILYGDFAPRSHRFVLVLEDLADLQSIPQVDAANEIQSKTAVRAAAKMHAL